MTYEGQLEKFSTEFDAMLKFKSCIQTSFNRTQSWTQVNLNKALHELLKYLYTASSEDYLNPISKEEIMQESGLGRRYDEFYLIDSGMTSSNGTDEPTEVFEIFHEDFNLNYFGNNNIIAWQRTGDVTQNGKQVFVKFN